MKYLVKFAMPVVIGWAAFLSAHLVYAEQVVVGQVAPLSGPDSSQGRAYAAGMQLFFNGVNKLGGVIGHSFVLVSKDDGGRPEETVKITKQILTTDRPMVLAGYFGNPNISELVSAGILEKEKIALVGYHVADIRAETPLIYNVRASLRDELSKISEHLATQGSTRVGLFYEDGPGSAALITTTEEITKKANLSIVTKASYEAGTTRVSSAIDKFMKATPQAIILVCSGAAGARFIELYRADGGAAQIFVSSGADMEGVAKRIAEDRLAFVSTVMRGVAIAQVVPNPYDFSRLAKELNEATPKDSKQDVAVGYVMMEGYIAAKVIVEAVRRQGKRPTREGMAATLDGIDNLNLGGYVVGFRPGMRSGSRFVDLSIISDTGKIRK